MRRSSSQLVDGFTLLELMIAVAIFALLALATYQMLESVLRTDKTTRLHEQRLRELSRGIWAFERDVLQVLARPIRDGYGDPQPALSGEEYGSASSIAVEFTRSGWRNPAGQLRSELQRVRWQLVGEQLQRRYWLVLDQSVDSSSRVQNVLSGVSELRLRYLDEDGQWHSQWPPLAGSESEKSLTLLPQALELTLQHNHYGLLSRFLRLPEAPAAMPTGAVQEGEGAESDQSKPVL